MKATRLLSILLLLAFCLLAFASCGESEAEESASFDGSEEQVPSPDEIIERIKNAENYRLETVRIGTTVCTERMQDAARQTEKGKDSFAYALRIDGFWYDNFLQVDPDGNPDPTNFRKTATDTVPALFLQLAGSATYGEFDKKTRRYPLRECTLTDSSGAETHFTEGYLERGEDRYVALFAVPDSALRFQFTFSDFGKVDFTVPEEIASAVQMIAD